MSWEEIQGWSNGIDRVYLDVLNEWMPGDIFVELGCWKGRSLRFLAEHAKGFDLRIYGVEKGWLGKNEASRDKDNEMNGTCLPTLHRNLEGFDNVTLIVSDSSKAASLFQDRSCKLVFIDTHHSAEQITKDIRAWMNKIRPDGYLAGHDYDKRHPQVMQVVNTFFGPCLWPGTTNCWGLLGSSIVPG